MSILFSTKTFISTLRLIENLTWSRKLAYLKLGTVKWFGVVNATGLILTTSPTSTDWCPKYWYKHL